MTLLLKSASCRFSRISALSIQSPFCTNSKPFNPANQSGLGPTVETTVNFGKPACALNVIVTCPGAFQSWTSGLSKLSTSPRGDRCGVIWLRSLPAALVSGSPACLLGPQRDPWGLGWYEISLETQWLSLHLYCSFPAGFAVSLIRLGLPLRRTACIRPGRLGALSTIG